MPTPSISLMYDYILVIIKYYFPFSKQMSLNVTHNSV